MAHRLRDVVLLIDCGGWPSRAETLRAVHPRVFELTPRPDIAPQATPFEVRDEWLCAYAADRNRACWLKTDAVSLSAIRQLDIDADHYWIIEADVLGSRARWAALFSDHVRSAADLIHPPIRMCDARTREATRCPDWYSGERLLTTSVYRISRQALAAYEARAVELKEVNCEVSLPAVVMRAGMNLRPLNAVSSHFNTQTFSPLPNILINPLLLNHPVKSNLVLDE